MATSMAKAIVSKKEEREQLADRKIGGLFWVFPKQECFYKKGKEG